MLYTGGGGVVQNKSMCKKFDEQFHITSVPRKDEPSVDVRRAGRQASARAQLRSPDWCLGCPQFPPFHRWCCFHWMTTEAGCASTESPHVCGYNIFKFLN